MAKKPSHEKLEQRVKELARFSHESKQTDKAPRESEKA